MKDGNKLCINLHSDTKGIVDFNAFAGVKEREQLIIDVNGAVMLNKDLSNKKTFLKQF